MYLHSTLFYDFAPVDYLLYLINNGNSTFQPLLPFKLELPLYNWKSEHFWQPELLFSTLYLIVNIPQNG